jgi:XTP/dITP diphosphohydrolase
MIKKIVLASNNHNKIIEFKHIFAQLNIEIIPQADLNIPPADEPYQTFIENSLYKAKHCAKHSKMVSLADDSGLCVDALNGEPGINSAVYAGLPKNDDNNNQKLLDMMLDIENRNAHFYCVLTLVKHYDDPQPVIADGILKGQIATQYSGNNGFGYDPLFYVARYNKCLAELPLDIKNQISHRKTATINLLLKLKEMDYATQ